MFVYFAWDLVLQLTVSASTGRLLKSVQYSFDFSSQMFEVHDNTPSPSFLSNGLTTMTSQCQVFSNVVNAMHVTSLFLVFSYLRNKVLNPFFSSTCFFTVYLSRWMGTWGFLSWYPKNLHQMELKYHVRWDAAPFIHAEVNVDQHRQVILTTH